MWARVVPEDQAGPHWGRDLIRDLLVPVALDEDSWARTDPWRQRLTLYDAAYLSLAVLHDAPLVTYDRVLTHVARDHVRVLAPGTADPGPS